jgi:AraC-like DNA-binding protein
VLLNQAAGGKVEAEGEELFLACFSVSLGYLFPLFDGAEVCRLQGVCRRLYQAKVYSASAALAQECHSLLQGMPPQRDLDHRTRLLRLAARILSVEFKETDRKVGGLERMEEPVAQFFEGLPTTELLAFSSAELAERAGLSRRQLNRLFHQYFGISLAALKLELRLLRAMCLLRNPEAKVISVAEECGFGHLGLFNSCFQRRFGASPGSWRKLAGPSQVQPAQPEEPGEAAAACPLRLSGLCPGTGGPETGNSTPPANDHGQPPGQLDHFPGAGRRPVLARDAEAAVV